MKFWYEGKVKECEGLAKKAYEDGDDVLGHYYSKEADNYREYLKSLGGW